MKWRNVLCGILAAAVLAVHAAAFEDTQGHWAQAAVDRWADCQVVSGYSDGRFGPDDPITRAQMAVILNNLLGWTHEAENTFTDLPTGVWYTPAVLRANAAGVMLGDGTRMRPCDPITREEAAVMLSRALRVSGGKGTVFADGASVSVWARDAVDTMSAHAFINGTPAGEFVPGAHITRAETATILNNAVKGYYDKAGSYSEGLNGGVVIIRAAGVTLRDMRLTGDVIIAPAASGSEVTLQNVVVEGRLIVQSGASAQVIAAGDSHLHQVVIEGENARFQLVGGAQADGITVSGSGASLRGLPEDAQVVVTAGTEQVVVNGHAAAPGTVTAGADVSTDPEEAEIEMDGPHGGSGSISGPGSGSTANPGGGSGGGSGDEPGGGSGGESGGGSGGEPGGESGEQPGGIEEVMHYWIDEQGVIHFDYDDLLGT